MKRFTVKHSIFGRFRNICLISIFSRLRFGSLDI